MSQRDLVFPEGRRDKGRMSQIALRRLLLRA